MDEGVIAIFACNCKKNKKRIDILKKLSRWEKEKNENKKIKGKQNNNIK